MSKGHTKAGTAGAFGHDGSPRAEYNVRGRSAGGKLHRAGAKKRKLEEETSSTVSQAVVMHKVKAETALEAKIVEALKRANAKIVANRETVADAQFARLEAICYAPFVSAAESARERLVAAGVIS